MSEANQGVHQGQLSWVVEFKARDAFTAGKHRGLGQVVELASVDKAFQDVLLDVKIIVANGREPVSEFGEVFDGLVDPIGVQIESELQNIPKAAPSSLSFSVSEKLPPMVLLRYPAGTLDLACRQRVRCSPVICLLKRNCQQRADL